MNETRVKPNQARWEAAAAFACFAASILSLALGFAFTTNWLIDAVRHPFLHAVGITLLIIGIPILILGGHCLDLMEKKNKKSSREFHAQGNGGPKTLHVVVGLVAFLSVLYLAPVTLNARQVKTVESGVPTSNVPELNRGGTPLVEMLSAPVPNSSEQKRLLFEEVDIPNRGLAKSDAQLSAASGNDSSDAVASADSSLSRTGTAAKADSERSGDERKASSQDSPPAPFQPKWQYGGFADFGYLLNFNHPANHLFRSRGTAFRTDSVFLNMAAFYVRKKPTEQSRWGVELTAHAGKDAQFFGFSATAPNIGGYKFLRQLGPTNGSYLAPVGKGVTLQAGIFTSLIGYDSLYAKDNLNYTRPWGADFTPYFMMGANASYPFNDKVTGTFFVVNGYWHLARANNVPSSGGQIAYKINPRVTVKETVLFGPHQSNKSFKFWRFLTDTIVERKTDRVTLAFEYTYSQERVDAPGSPRALMVSSQLPVRWNLNKRWAVAVRPEVFWDRDGRWTLARQTVKAFTTTLEYRLPYRWTNTIFRLEHRFDDSRGPDGGFFRGREVQPGVVGLTPNQHLLIFATIFTFDL